MSSPSKAKKVNDWSADDLERAAKYMRELDGSKNASAALELARREQDVEIQTMKAKEKEHESHKAQASISLEKVRAEEFRKNKEHQREGEKNLLDYKLTRERESHQYVDQLARQREADKRKDDLEMERMKASLRLKAEEELQAERRRAEEYKARIERDNMEHRAKLERGNMEARALAEATGRIKEQRENEDVDTRKLRARAGEDRITRLESINATISGLGNSLSTFILDTPRVTATLVALTALAAGVFVSREGARVAAAVVQKRLLTPPLVRETSRGSGVFGWGKGGGGGEGGAGTLADVVLNRTMVGRVEELSASVRATKANGANFRNLMFFGPPGTGKTMVAKRLARTSGLDYAIMSGGDVGPLGKDGVTELHKLMDWADRSPKGTLLFIDEADAFLASRSRTAMSEEQRNALNALLFRTGEASSKLMLVFATNRPGDLDAAVLDRCDESLLFDLPDQTSRRALVSLYFQKYVSGGASSSSSSSSSSIITVDPGVDSAFLDSVADRLAGFSGRGISKFMMAVQGTVFGRRGSPIVNKDLVEEVLKRKLSEPGFGEFEDYVGQKQQQHKKAGGAPELR